MKQHDFYLTSPIKFARPGGDVGESSLIVLSEPMYKHAGAMAALKGHYTQAILQARAISAKQAIAEPQGESGVDDAPAPAREDQEALVRYMLCIDGAIAEALVSAFIRLIKIPGIASLDGSIELSDIHLAGIPYDDVERMAVSFLSHFIEKSSETRRST
jgi:hypothetical protein